MLDVPFYTFFYTYFLYALYTYNQHKSPQNVLYTFSLQT